MRRVLTIFAVIVAALTVQSGLAHFLVLLPDNDIVSAGDDRTVNFEILFTHPMEQGPVMNMGTPAAFGVLVNGEVIDLKPQLRMIEIDGSTAYRTSYRLREPGDHVFYIEPAPYIEPAEKKMIVHYTKVIVSAFDAQTGWDAPVGQPVEIEPLVRPYGLWTGNLFRGIVRRAGEPVPFAEIEVEYYNEDGAVEIPAEAFVTQVIKANALGEFAYAMPRAGWWGFAALVDGEPMENPESGEMVGVELGGLIWVRVADMK